MSRIKSRTRVVAIALAALLAAGLPAAATAAGPTEISGRVVLPAGVSNEGFWVETSTWDASTGRWKYARMVAPEPDGSFTLATFGAHIEHRLELVPRGLTRQLGGYYAGPGRPLVSSPLDGVAVHGGTSGIVLEPVDPVRFEGTFSVPSGFDWDPGYLYLKGYEITADGSLVGTEMFDFLRAEGSDGEFSMERARPGARYVLHVSDPSADRVEVGYAHAGEGIVSNVDHATPWVAGSRPHVTISYSHVAPRLTAVDAPRVTGEPRVGAPLTASPGAWSLRVVDVSYEWMRDGAAIPGASAPTYVPTAADVGARLTVRVTATYPGYVAAATSAPSAAVAKGAAPRATTLPRVTGTVRVDQTVHATTGAWDAPGVTTSVQWLLDGAPVKGATQPTFTLAPAHAGKWVSVRVTATRDGYEKGVATSSSASVAKGAAPRATKPPKVSGTARLGTKLKASKGSWDTAGVAVSYQWLRGGKAIKGATSRTYTLKKKDVGKRVSVRVTARKSGYDDGASSSKAVKVKKAKPKVTAKVKLAGKRAKVVVRVKASGYPKPAGTVRVKVGKKTVKAKLKASAKGRVTVRLPRLARGAYRIKVTYTPNAKSTKHVTKASSKRVTLRVR